MLLKIVYGYLITKGKSVNILISSFSLDPIRIIASAFKRCRSMRTKIMSLESMANKTLPHISGIQI